jgi:hypothetical protein
MKAVLAKAKKVRRTLKKANPGMDDDEIDALLNGDVEILRRAWENVAAMDKFADMSESIHAVLENIEKWYTKTEDTD